MKIKGIYNVEKALKRYNGENAIVSISHALYGDQKLKCKLDCIFDEQRVGFRIGNQEIFVYRNEIVDCGIEGDIYFADDLMKIKIKLHKQ